MRGVTVTAGFDCGTAKGTADTVDVTAGAAAGGDASVAAEKSAEVGTMVGGVGAMIVAGQAALVTESAAMTAGVASLLLTSRWNRRATGSVGAASATGAGVI